MNDHKNETVAEHYGSYENFQRHELRKMLKTYRARLPIDILRYMAAAFGKNKKYRYFRKLRLQLCRRRIRELTEELEQGGNVNKYIRVLWEIHKDEPYRKGKE